MVVFFSRSGFLRLPKVGHRAQAVVDDDARYGGEHVRGQVQQVQRPGRRNRDVVTDARVRGVVREII